MPKPCNLIAENFKLDFLIKQPMRFQFIWLGAITNLAPSTCCPRRSKAAINISSAPLLMKSVPQSQYKSLLKDTISSEFAM